MNIQNKPAPPRILNLPVLNETPNILEDGIEKHQSSTN